MYVFLCINALIYVQYFSFSFAIFRLFSLPPLWAVPYGRCHNAKMHTESHLTFLRAVFKTCWNDHFKTGNMKRTSADVSVVWDSSERGAGRTANEKRAVLHLDVFICIIPTHADVHICKPEVSSYFACYVGWCFGRMGQLREGGGTNCKWKKSSFTIGKRSSIMASISSFQLELWRYPRRFYRMFSRWALRICETEF